MTAKDFIAIAQAIKDGRDAISASFRPAADNDSAGQRRIAQVFDSMARALADTCAKQNPKFQRMRFLSACGVDTANQPLHRNN